MSKIRRGLVGGGGGGGPTGGTGLPQGGGGGVLGGGGGVGGLTAATAFAQRGVEVVLIERRPAFDVPGVGLGQPANALRVYDALGVLPQIISAGFIYDHMCIFDPNRQLIVKHRFLLGDDRV